MHVERKPPFSSLACSKEQHGSCCPRKPAATRRRLWHLTRSTQQKDPRYAMHGFCQLNLCCRHREARHAGRLSSKTRLPSQARLRCRPSASTNALATRGHFSTPKQSTSERRFGDCTYRESKRRCQQADGQEMPALAHSAFRYRSQKVISIHSPSTAVLQRLRLAAAVPEFCC